MTREILRIRHCWSPARLAGVAVPRTWGGGSCLRAWDPKSQKKKTPAGIFHLWTTGGSDRKLKSAARLRADFQRGGKPVLLTGRLGRTQLLSEAGRSTNCKTDSGSSAEDRPNREKRVLDQTRFETTESSRCHGRLTDWTAKSGKAWKRRTFSEKHKQINRNLGPTRPRMNR